MTDDRYTLESRRKRKTIDIAGREISSNMHELVFTAVKGSTKQMDPSAHKLLWSFEYRYQHAVK